MTLVRPARARARRRRVLFCCLLALAASPHRAPPARSAPVHHPLAHASAHAAGPVAGGWTPAGCGREPVAPTVETATIARYNSSIDAVTSYDASARAYNACVSRTATAEQTAISAQAKQRIDSIQVVTEAVQRRIAANFQTLGAALKKGPPAH